jgi:sterol desaturase/sphingolipid hydroxylase (fatty acid hydroxylase superfamily)
MLCVYLSSFSLFSICFAFLIISIVVLRLINSVEAKYPSVVLDSLSKKDLVKGLSLVFVTAIGAGTCIVVGGVILLKPLQLFKCNLNSWVMIILALALTDLAYYWTHRSLSHCKKKGLISDWFRNNHVPHHAIKVLDFHRGNISTFVDTAITGFQVPLIIIATLFSMPWQEVLVTYLLILLLQSTHHANYTFHIGFMRYVFVDNHIHKLHHCPRGYDVNFGAIFSIWDIFFRTYYENWSLSPSYLAKNRIALPLQKIDKFVL